MDVTLTSKIPLSAAKGLRWKPAEGADLLGSFIKRVHDLYDLNLRCVPELQAFLLM